MKYGTSFIFPYIPPINPFGLKRRFPEAFTYRQRLCIALPCMQFIPLRPYLPNDRYQDFPFFFSRMNTHSFPFPIPRTQTCTRYSPCSRGSSHAEHGSMNTSRRFYPRAFPCPGGPFPSGVFRHPLPRSANGSFHFPELEKEDHVEQIQLLRQAMDDAHPSRLP